MKYLKTFESIYDMVKPYLNKYIIYKKNTDDNYYLLNVREEMPNGNIFTHKLYTLKKNNIIKKNKPHSYYSFNVNDIKNIVYYSDNILDVYRVLGSIYDAKQYNL